MSDGLLMVTCVCPLGLSAIEAQAYCEELRRVLDRSFGRSPLGYPALVTEQAYDGRWHLHTLLDRERCGDFRELMDGLRMLAPGPWGVVPATSRFVDVYMSKGGRVS